MADSTSEDLSKEFEEKFSYKYGTDDEYFLEAVKKNVGPPPCIHPWYGKPRRNFDYTRHGRSYDQRDNRQWDSRGHGRDNRRQWDRREGHNNYRHQPYDRPNRDGKRDDRTHFKDRRE